MAHFAALTYGDGYPEWGEMRVVTYNDEFKDRLQVLAEKIAAEFRITWRVYSRPGTITENSQHSIVLNSTLIRRAFFDDSMRPNYDSIYSLAMHDILAPHFQAGLSDAEGSLLLPVPIEYPHGRIFAILNDDRRLLGISRLSLINKLRLEPSSVRIRLASKKGREHVTHGHLFVTRKNNYLIEILSGAKLKWLRHVGTLLLHPDKESRAMTLLNTFSSN